MKNNKSPRYDALSADMIQATGPVGTQWQYQILGRIWMEARVPEPIIKHLLYQFTKMKPGHNVGIIKGIHTGVKHSKFTRGC
jgi:hypothetical protein